MYMGHEGLYSLSYESPKLENCKTCSNHVEIIKVEENELWKNVLSRIIQSIDIKSNQEFKIFHKNGYICNIYKESNENSDLKVESEIEENKNIKELVDSGDIAIDKLFEIIPSDDKNNSRMVKLKRPQDYNEE